MQLDFFRKLIPWSSPAPQPPPIQKAPAPTPTEPPLHKAEPDPAAEIRTWKSLARDLLCQAGCPDLAARVEVRWNRRMRSTAGLAFPGRALIELNPRLLQFGPAEINRTLRHELAHLLAQHRAGRRRIAPHGEKWRQACIELGLPDETRCHTLPLPQRRLPRPHKYQCPHCAVIVHRARPFRRKVACLACCRQTQCGRVPRSI